MQIRKHIDGLPGLLNSQEWIAQLLVRLFVGYFFVETGWGKVHNLDGFAQRFAGWGIPYPHFNAALSAYTEFIGGLLILFGIATRLASIPDDHQRAGCDTRRRYEEGKQPRRLRGA